MASSRFRLSRLFTAMFVVQCCGFPLPAQGRAGSRDGAFPVTGLFAGEEPATQKPLPQLPASETRANPMSQASTIAYCCQAHSAPAVAAIYDRRQSARSQTLAASVRTGLRFRWPHTLQRPAPPAKCSCFRAVQRFGIAPANYFCGGASKRVDLHDWGLTCRFDRLSG